MTIMDKHEQIRTICSFAVKIILFARNPALFIVAKHFGGQFDWMDRIPPRAIVDLMPATGARGADDGRGITAADWSKNG